MDQEKLQATILVIFGITGDLSRRYLLPALTQIAKKEHLDSRLKILGVSRQDIDLKAIFTAEEKVLEQHAETLKIDYAKAADYENLKNKLAGLDGHLGGNSQTIFYFAVPPDSVPQIVGMLGSAGLNGKNTKLLLEKPFGKDLASAEKLINETAKYFPEEQVYRIDHYLAKEMAQNITVFLGSNTLFRGIWSNQFIDSIDITAIEKIGIEGRSGFYESTGALRDIIQSHLLQLASLVLMEPCSDIFDFAEIPRRRQAALEALQLADPARAVRGQYNGYKEEANNPNSTIETFASVELSSTDPRWQGVLLRLTTGKNLDAKLTQITIHFKKKNDLATNSLIYRIQPDEGIELDLWVKQPGYERRLEKMPLSFSYGEHYGKLPDAYEQLLVDAMRSNHSLFTASGEVLASWKMLQPLLESWAGNADNLRPYNPGSTAQGVIGQTG